MAGRMPGLAPRSFGVGFGRPLGEGGGLPLPRPAGLLQLGLESFHLGTKLVDLAGLDLDAARIGLLHYAADFGRVVAQDLMDLLIGEDPRLAVGQVPLALAFGEGTDELVPIEGALRLGLCSVARGDVGRLVASVSRAVK